MITPDGILKKATRKLPEVLIAWLENRPCFPLILRCDKTLSANNYRTLDSELGLLLRHSKEAKGYGYRVELSKERNFKYMGRQELPENIIFDEAVDFWKYIEQEKAWEMFQRDAALIRKELPQLEDWLRKNPLKVIAAAGKWSGCWRFADILWITHSRVVTCAKFLPSRILNLSGVTKAF